MIANPGQAEAQYVYDGFRNMLGGMDSSRTADLIEDQYCALAVNIAFRGGKAKNRPKITQVLLSDEDGAETVMGRELFTGGTTYFNVADGRGYLVAVYGGYVILFDLDSGGVTNLNPADPNIASLRHYFVQAEEFLVIQNGIDIPLIYNGSTLRRSHVSTNNPIRAIASLTQIDGIATLVTIGPHGFENGAYVQLGSVTPSAWDGDYYITVIDPTTISFEVDSSLEPVAVTAVSTLAGTAGATGNADGLISAARFNGPRGVAVDNAGNIYVADTANHRIRKITPAGAVTTLAGSTAGSADGTGAAAQFNGPQNLCVDSLNNVWVADTNNNTIRRVTSAGVVTTFAGTAGVTGSADGTGVAAEFDTPTDITIDSSGNLYVADSNNHTIRKIDSGAVVTTFAGAAGVSGSTDGVTTDARFNSPRGVAIGDGDVLYVADSLNHTIRKIDATLLVTTYAGTAGVYGSADGIGAAARFNVPSSVATIGVNVYVADTGNTIIRQVGLGANVTTVAGVAGAYGSANGTGTAARFNQPFGVAADPTTNNLFVADTFNQIIRAITSSGIANAFVRYVEEIPVGLAMAYGQGRIFVTDPSRIKWIAGDLLRGDVNQSTANILRFTENVVLNEGGAYNPPTSMGRITALAFPGTQDTATGQGSLFGFCEYGVASWKVENERSTWKEVPQFQTVAFLNIGCTSQESCVSFNADFYFRDQVGLRSYRNARADINSYGQVPLSAEMNRILDAEKKDQLGFISAANFDNRFLMTCSPVFAERRVPIVSITRYGTTAVIETELSNGARVDQKVVVAGTNTFNGEFDIVEVMSSTAFSISVDETTAAQETPADAYYTGEPAGTEIYHHGIIALDFTAVSGVGQKNSSAYDGVWTGAKFQRIVSGTFSGVVRAFAFVYGENGQNQLFEISRDYGQDFSELSGESPVNSVMETRRFDFQTPFSLKKLLRGEIWVTDLYRDTEFKIYYRPNGQWCWIHWHDFKLEAQVDEPVSVESSELTEGLIQKLPQVRGQISLPTPKDGCDPVSKRLNRLGYDFQVRVEWAGRATVAKVMLIAAEQPEAVNGGCP